MSINCIRQSPLDRTKRRSMTMVLAWRVLCFKRWPAEPQAREFFKKSGMVIIPSPWSTSRGMTFLFLVSAAALLSPCLLYTSDAADDLLCVDLGGRRII